MDPGDPVPESADLYVSDVAPDSPEHQMGLRRGARIESLDGERPVSWERFRESALQGGRRLRTVRFVLDGQPILARNCHCSRCRLARSAAHASNVLAPLNGVPQATLSNPFPTTGAAPNPYRTGSSW